MTTGNSPLTPDLGLRRYGILPALHPARSKTVLEPPALAPGNWAGACDVILDDREGNFYLYARTRRPRDPNDPEARGARAAILQSRDGHTFHEVWNVHRTQLGTRSIEKGSLLILPDGRHRLYLSYECPDGAGWQIDLLEGNSFASLDIAGRRTVLRPADVGAGHVKDPIVLLAGGLTLLYANYALPNGGEAAGLATSADGVLFEWFGRVLPASPDGCWDTWTSRATGILYTAPVWYLFYDGAGNPGECYEEQMGVAVGFTPYAFVRLTPNGPLVPGAARGGLRYDGGRILPSVGGIRYLSPILGKNRLLYYYEWTRPDGSHELRVEDYSQ